MSVEIENTKNTDNRMNSFLQKRSNLIVFLKKNNNGKYQVVKDIEKYVKQPSVTAPEQK